MVTTVGLLLVLVVPISETSVFLLHLKPVGYSKLALWTPHVEQLYVWHVYRSAGERYVRRWKTKRVSRFCSRKCELIVTVPQGNLQVYRERTHISCQEAVGEMQMGGFWLWCLSWSIWAFEQYAGKIARSNDKELTKKLLGAWMNQPRRVGEQQLILIPQVAIL